MKKILAGLAVATGLFATGPAALAQEEPPRGPCNAGTMRAHQTVPHDDIPGHVVAHASIPHCHE